MPDLWMDVDVALGEVPINLAPLIDNTDFKTRENSVTFDQAQLDLVWNFITTGGVFTQTSVTPTDTGGDYDWIAQGFGMYTIEIPASSGASINNDAEGVGWFSGAATGVLLWRGPTIGFRAAGLNNLLIDDAFSATRALAGTALPDAVADAAGGLVISDLGGVDADALVTSIAAILADTGGTLQAELDAIQAAVITNAAGVDIAADIIALKTETAAILVDTMTTLQAELDAIQAAVITNAAGADIAADIIAAKAVIDTILVDTGTTLQAELDAIQAAVITNAAGADVAADIIALKTESALTVADTAELQTDWANGGRLDLLIDAIKVVTDLFNSAQTEPTGVPAANETPLAKLGRMYMGMRNRVTVTATKKTVFGDDDIAEWEHDLSDDGTTYDESEANAV